MEYLFPSAVHLFDRKVGLCPRFTHHAPFHFILFHAGTNRPLPKMLLCTIHDLKGTRLPATGPPNATSIPCHLSIPDLSLPCPPRRDSAFVPTPFFAAQPPFLILTQRQCCCSVFGGRRRPSTVGDERHQQGSLAPGAPRPWFLFGIPLPGLFGGFLGQAIGVYRGTLHHHFHGAFGAAESRRHGEAAVALRAVSFWTADSPWQVGTYCRSLCWCWVVHMCCVCWCA